MPKACLVPLRHPRSYHVFPQHRARMAFGLATGLQYTFVTSTRHYYTNLRTIVSSRRPHLVRAMVLRVLRQQNTNSELGVVIRHQCTRINFYHRLLSTRIFNMFVLGPFRRTTGRARIDLTASRHRWHTTTESNRRMMRGFTSSLFTRGAHVR